MLVLASALRKMVIFAAQNGIGTLRASTLGVSGLLVLPRVLQELCDLPQ